MEGANFDISRERIHMEDDLELTLLGDNLIEIPLE